MPNLSYLTLFRTLDSNETQAFRRYLKRMHGNSTVALEVFEFFRKHPGAVNLDVPALCQKLYRNRSAATRKNLLNTLSDLYQWLKAFLLHTKANDKSPESQLLWLSVLKQKKLHTEFSKHARALVQEANAAPKTNMLDYLRSMAVHHYALYGLSQMQELPEPAAVQKNLQELEYYSQAVRLRLGCLSMHYHKMHPTDSGMWNPAAVRMAGMPASAHGQPLLQLYQLLANLIESNSADDFIRMEAALAAHAAQIDPAELDEILLYLFNYASAKVRVGESPADWKRTHQLNLLAIKHGVFFQKGVLPGAQFLNIVNAASKAREFPWAENFIQKFRGRLPVDSRKHTVLVAKAIVNNETGNFDAVVKSLENTHMKDIHLYIRSKALLLLSYYELKTDTEKIFDLCANFELYLRRHRKELEKAVQGTHNFVRIYKMLVGQRTAKTKIRAQIDQTELLYFRSWLNEKLQHYEAKLAVRRKNP
ncbi:MAG: hypothetical protein IPM36_10350 [Lewinellaceae bacterium]|nr:hypothetical protein [Lewinellaceae bacterium]